MALTAGQKLRATDLAAIADRPRTLVVANTVTAYGAYTATVFSSPGTANDPFGMWSAGAPTRLTCTTTAVGLWMFQPVISYVPSTTAHFGELRLNGVAIAGSGASSAAPTGINHVMALPVTFIRLTVGDYVELWGYASAVTNSATSAGQVPKLDGVRLGA